MKTPTLQKTTNYALFKSDVANRSVEKITKLKKSMQKYGFLPAYPLHTVKNCNGLIVKDGQHRKEVAQALKLPIYYVVCDDDNISIPEINCAQRAWSVHDFIQSFVNSGNDNYKQLQEFMSTTGLPAVISASLLGGEGAKSGNQCARVRDGSFAVKDSATDYAFRVAAIISEIGKVVKWSNNSHLVDAVSKCCRVQKFNETQLIAKFTAQPGLLIQQPNTKAFLGMLEGIYNYRSRHAIPLSFMASEEGARRNVAKKKP